MANTLQDELRLTRPMKSLYEEALLNIVRTEVAVREWTEPLLAEHGLSRVQYNILRILRGAGEKGLCRQELGDRLLTRMPDVSRLLDRMEAAGLVSRVRSTEDRRLVHTTLTRQGLALVNELDQPVADALKRSLGHMTDEKLRTLIELLTEARARP